ncbi:MAG: hypothetical protein ACUVSX_01790 [Aggregatilineales bacterium]
MTDTASGGAIRPMRIALEGSVSGDGAVSVLTLSSSSMRITLPVASDAQIVFESVYTSARGCENDQIACPPEAE